MKRGRATFQTVCAECRDTIEDGDPIVLGRIGDGIRCHACGLLAEHAQELALDLSGVKPAWACPNCSNVANEPAVRNQNEFGVWEERCEDEFHEGADTIPVHEVRP